MRMATTSKPAPFSNASISTTSKRQPVPLPYRNDVSVQSRAVKPILDWNLSWNDFDEEGGQIDGTIAHSIERLIGLSTTEIFRQKLLTTYCGYSLSKQHQTDKSIIESKNQLRIQGFEKVIQFKPQKLHPDWSLKSNINPKSLHIHWVIPNFTPGLGGHMTISEPLTIWNAVDINARSGFIPSSRGMTSQAASARCTNVSLTNHSSNCKQIRSTCWVTTRRTLIL